MIFDELLSAIKENYPKITFEPGDHFAWNSQNSQIIYRLPENEKEDNKSSNKLLHELAHAKLKHSDYRSDAELLRIESSAWSLTKELCQNYNIKFNKKEQDESLASYINWASSRSRCPKCQKNGLQTTPTIFLCPNCDHKWTVGRSRFTRTYRH